MFVARLGFSGNLLRNTFIGSPGLDYCGGLTLHNPERIYIAGLSDATWGSPVRPFSNDIDAFVVTLKKILYPPSLSLKGERKTENAWIIQKDYVELKISITEHESPMLVSDYILSKSVNGIWVEMQSYSGPGTYEYTDKFYNKHESVSYKLTAIAPDGSSIVENSILTL